MTNGAGAATSGPSLRAGNRRNHEPLTADMTASDRRERRKRKGSVHETTKRCRRPAERLASRSRLVGPPRTSRLRRANDGGGGGESAWKRTWLGAESSRIAQPLRLSHRSERSRAPRAFRLIGTFPLLHSDDREAVVGYDDRHLDFRIVVDVREGPADSQIIGMTTLVRRRNLFGRLYLAAVMPFHKAIVPTLLAGVNDRSRAPVIPPA